MANLPLTHANLVQILGIESLPLDERKEIVESAVELIETRTLNRTMETFNDKQQKEFVDALESQNTDTIYKLLNKKKVNLLAITEGEVEKLKRELLEIAKEK